MKILRPASSGRDSVLFSLQSWMAVVVLVLFVLVSRGLAQQWAEKMFDHFSHDFGVVVRGQKVEHRFPFKNIYIEDVHVASVVSTCGCTIPSVTKNHLKTYETSEIVARINTTQFTGRKEATIIVTFSEPFPAEVRLHCSVFIRTDVVLDPGSVNFGTVYEGTGPLTKSLTISYAGRNDWQIVRVENTDPNLEVSLKELRREFGRVDYQLDVTLNPETPPGYIRSHIVLVTNDYSLQSQRIPVLVEGVVLPAIAVRPSPLMLGLVAPNEKIVRTLVLQAKEAFRITSIECPDDRFKFIIPGEAKNVHIVPVIFLGKEGDPKIDTTITIKTDIAGGKTVAVKVSGEVAQDKEQVTPSESEAADPQSNES